MLVLESEMKKKDTHFKGNNFQPSDKVYEQPQLHLCLTDTKKTKKLCPL